MSVIGSVFVGTAAARVQAGNIFRQLNKVVLATVIDTVLPSLTLVGKCTCTKARGRLGGR